MVLKKAVAMAVVGGVVLSMLGGCASQTENTGATGTTTGATTSATLPQVTVSETPTPVPNPDLPSIQGNALLTQENTNPEPTATVEVPEAAAAAGMTKLAFSDDFDSYDTIDFSGEGKEGYNWYVDRPYGGDTLTQEEITIQDGVMTFAPKNCPASIGLPTFSAKGKTGYAMHFGYAEARIRFSVEELSLASEGRNGFPSFWGVSVVDVVGESWNRVGELDILEAHQVEADNPQSDVIYTGTIHDHVKLADGTKQIATNVTNATGAFGLHDVLDSEWHTYAALWTENYIAWYMDGQLMHSARFSESEYPVYYYRDIEEPLNWNESIESSLAGRTWQGAQSILNSDRMVLFLGAHETWPMEVDWVRVWETPTNE